MLPRFNDTPKYTMTIPSTGKEVTYRPYLVKEEKILLMAFESGDNKNALRALADTIVSCVEDVINKNLLTSFDIEYMFTQIRGKSAGELSQVRVTCAQVDSDGKVCGHENEINVDLDEVYVSKKNEEASKGVIKINDRYTLNLKYPSYLDMVRTVDMKEDISSTFESIHSALYSLVDEEEESQVLFADETSKEVQEFLESLPSSVFSKIRQFLDSMPKTVFKVEFKCSGCGKETRTELEGIENFL